MDIGRERDPVPDELLERSPEALESCGGVEVLFGRPTKLTSEPLHGLLESALELAAEVGDDVVGFLEPDHGGLEEAGHCVSAGFGGVGLKDEWSPRVGVEDAAEPEVTGAAEGVERREVEHPGVVNKAGDHRLSERSVVELLDHAQRGAEERLSPDSADGALRDFPASARDGGGDGEGGSELCAVHGLNERTGDVGNPRDRGHRFHEGADGFGFFVDSGFPVGDGSGRDREALSGEVAIPSREVPELEGFEALVGIVSGPVGRRDLEPPRSEEIGGSLRDVSAEFGGLEFGLESRDLGGAVSRSSSGETGGLAEEFGGDEKGTLCDWLRFDIEGAFPEEAKSGLFEPSWLLGFHRWSERSKGAQHSCAV